MFLQPVDRAAHKINMWYTCSSGEMSSDLSLSIVLNMASSSPRVITSSAKNLQNSSTESEPSSV